MIAAAVSSLFAASAMAKDKAPPAKPEKAAAAQVKCGGVNDCKGKGACGNAKHDCAGYNECKGQGWSLLSDADCKTKKGTVIP